jgi:hypothetical protein
VKDEEKEKKK